MAVAGAAGPWARFFSAGSGRLRGARAISHFTLFICFILNSRCSSDRVVRAEKSRLAVYRRAARGRVKQLKRGQFTHTTKKRDLV